MYRELKCFIKPFTRLKPFQTFRIVIRKFYRNSVFTSLDWVRVIKHRSKVLFIISNLISLLQSIHVYTYIYNSIDIKIVETVFFSALTTSYKENLPSHNSMPLPYSLLMEVPNIGGSIRTWQCSPLINHTSQTIHGLLCVLCFQSLRLSQCFQKMDLPLKK